MYDIIGPAEYRYVVVRYQDLFSKVEAARFCLPCYILFTRIPVAEAPR
jgi:hypothetical protein